MARSALRLVELPRWPIKRMLRLEEALVRHEPGNWCLITALPPQQPTVVVGLGGKPERLLDASELKKRPVPVVRRFTGGGTVVVNGGVVVTSLIVDKGCEACAPFPRDIMKWTEDIYRKAFADLIDSDQFALRDHDYVFQDRKVGGNAQSIVKDKWIHHTSFLWDFDDADMRYLTLPEKRPEYRGDRSHDDFLAKLGALSGVDSGEGAARLASGLFDSLGAAFDVERGSLNELEAVEARHSSGGWRPVDFPPSGD